MNAYRIPFALAALTLATLTPAQHNVQIGHMLVFATSAPSTINQVLQTANSEHTRSAFERACADADLKLVQVRFEVNPASSADPRSPEPLRSCELWFTIHAELGSVPTAETKVALYEKVIGDVRRRLDEQLVEQPRQLQLQRLARCQAETADLGKRVTDLRMQIAVARGTSAESIRGNVAELERKRLDTELELRTEEATQQRVRELLLQTNKELRANSAERDAIMRQRDRLQTEIQAVAKQGSIDAAARAQNEDLATQVATIQNQMSRLQDEFNQLVAMSSALADDARRTTLATHRLTARMRVLEDILADQKRHLASAIEVEAATAQFEAELDEAIVARDEAQVRARQCRDRLAELEPVRLQIWK